MTDPSVPAVTVQVGSHAAPDPAPAPQPAAPGSGLAALRERRAALLQRLYVDLRVPRWGDHDTGPRIYVRFTPAAPSEFQERVDKARKKTNKAKDWMVTENALVLVSACQGVWAWEGDDDPPLGDPEALAAVRDRQLSLRDGDPHGSWTRFDPDLAHSLGLPENCGAAAVVKALYLTEPDLASTVNRLLEWSGISLQQESTDFFGT